MRHDKRLDPTRRSIRGWYYNPEEKWWHHRHRKGTWPFRKKYYIGTTLDGFCEKCGKQIPEDLKRQVTEE